MLGNIHFKFYTFFPKLFWYTRDKVISVTHEVLGKFDIALLGSSIDLWAPSLVRDIDNYQ